MTNQITLYCEKGTPVNLENLVFHLNSRCRTIQFRVGRTPFKPTKSQIQFPQSYKELPGPLLKETRKDYLAIFITQRPYYNNHFFEYYNGCNRVIVSAYGWKYLTSLSMNNGVVFFLCWILSRWFHDDGFRHNKKTGCIYDFAWDKTGIDSMMRMAYVCPRCLARIGNARKTLEKVALLSVVRSLLNDIGSASKWNQDIIEYWKFGGSGREVGLLQSDFIPEEDPDNSINTTRAHIRTLREVYLELTEEKAEAKKKGAVLEKLAKYFFGLIKGWKCIRSNANLRDCEIDLIYDTSLGPDRLKPRMGNNLYIECKYRAKKSDARDISHFIMNLKTRGLKHGIFFSWTGITGYDPKNWQASIGGFKRLVDVQRQEGIYVLPLVRDDVEAVRNGKNLIDLLADKFNQFVMI